jgi:hypothetical protein
MEKLSLFTCTTKMPRAAVEFYGADALVSDSDLQDDVMGEDAGGN